MLVTNGTETDVCMTVTDAHTMGTNVYKTVTVFGVNIGFGVAVKYTLCTAIYFVLYAPIELDLQSVSITVLFIVTFSVTNLYCNKFTTIGQGQNSLKLFVFGRAAMPFLCRDLSFLPKLTYHRNVSVAVYLPIFFFSFV